MHARRTVAERVARILERAEQEITNQEAAAAPATPAPQPVRAAEAGRPRRPARFRQAGRSHASAHVQRNHRRHRDRRTRAATRPSCSPKRERKAKIVNGHAKSLGPISGRLGRRCAVDRRPRPVGARPRSIGAGGYVQGRPASIPARRAPPPTVLAVFGVMMLMSVYFIFWNRVVRRGFSSSA